MRLKDLLPTRRNRLEAKARAIQRQTVRKIEKKKETISQQNKKRKQNIDKEFIQEIQDTYSAINHIAIPLKKCTGKSFQDQKVFVQQSEFAINTAFAHIHSLVYICNSSQLSEHITNQDALKKTKKITDKFYEIIQQLLHSMKASIDKKDEDGLKRTIVSLADCFEEIKTTLEDIIEDQNSATP